jgi:hypothetical protein
MRPQAGDIAAAMDGAAVLPERTQHLAFGEVAAAWSMIGRLGISQIIDEVTGSRRVDAAAPGDPGPEGHPDRPAPRLAAPVLAR